MREENFEETFARMFCNSPNLPLLNHVKSQCVFIDRDANHEKISQMKKWCEENIGEVRPHHPLDEAVQGWQDYFDEEWCFFSRFFSDYFVFWIYNKEKRMQFALMFT
jgi:hypothetical protein